jgi:hypothetical protein
MTEIFDREGIASLLRQKKVPSRKRSKEGVTIRRLSPTRERPPPRKRAEVEMWPWKGEGTFGAAMTDPNLFPLQREGGGARNLGVRATTRQSPYVAGYFDPSPTTGATKYLPRVPSFTFDPPAGASRTPLRKQPTAEWINRRNRRFGGERPQEHEIVLFEGEEDILTPSIYTRRYDRRSPHPMGFRVGFFPQHSVWRPDTDEERQHTAKHEVAHETFTETSLARPKFTAPLPPNYHELLKSGLSTEEANTEWDKLNDKYDAEWEIYEKKVKEFEKENPFSEHEMVYVMDWINAPTRRERENARRWLNRNRPEGKPEISGEDMIKSLQPGTPMRKYFEKISDASNERMIAEGRPPILDYKKQIDDAISQYPALRKKAGGMIERNPYPYEARAI